MTFELGVIVCWLLFLVWACSSGIARALSMEGYQRSRLIGMPSGLPLLLALSFMLCLSLRPAQALASDTDTTVDETEKQNELPDNFVEVMESRTSGDQYVAIEGDRAVLKSIPIGAKSASSDIALDLFKEMVTGEISSNAATQRIMHDLAWRYYKHPDKRDKIPLWKVRDYDPVYGYAVYSLQECTSYGDWCAKNKYYNDLFAGFLTASFQLRELNHQGKSWSANSPAASELYSDWYYYYEGMPSSDTPGDDDVYSLTVPIPQTVTMSPFALTQNDSSTVYSMTKSDDYSYINNYCQNNNFTDWLAIYYTRDNYLTIFVSKSDIHIKLRDLATGTANGRFYVRSHTQMVYFSGYVSVSGNSITVGSINGPTSTHITTADGYEYAYTASYTQQALPWISVSTGSSGGSNEPVPSPGPIPKPQPQQPIITTVNSPTYNNVTYQTINQTDVDLQPIIDALAVHDENMQDAWNAYSILFDDWMDTLKTVIEGWEQVWLDWTNTLYQDLQYYLDQIQYVLYEILMALQSEPYVPVPEPETVTINFDNAVNQLSTRFPFSIPWDVKLLMELLEQPRQAPEFDLPVVMTEYTVHIDFSPFENMAAVSRFMSLILFTGGLLMATKKMIGY